MAISTTGRVECRITVVLAFAATFGCQQAPAQDKARVEIDPLPPAVAQPRGSESAPPAPLEPRYPVEPKNVRSVEIIEFDCAKHEDYQPGVGVKVSQRLSQWRAGGPSGASWNASDLKCYSTVRAACSGGAMQFQLLIGQRVASEKTISITAAASQRIEIDVPESTWRRGLDVARKPALPYRTALFNLRVEVTCNEPEAFGPATERYADVADVRSFIAGFASGE
jgi:hypothetical protein